MSELQLGSNIEHNGDIWRIVRLVHDDLSLFENRDTIFIVKESYAMIKSPTGLIDFITISSERLPYEGKTSGVLALSPLPWRKP